MYKILKEFTMKYREGSLAEFTDETAEKILKGGKYIELIPETEEVAPEAEIESTPAEEEVVNSKNIGLEKAERKEK